jgi:hypothetical protein
MRPLAVTLTIALAACSKPAPEPVQTRDANLSEILAVRRDSSIDALRYSNGLRDSTTSVIRDAAQWRSAWATITSNHSPKALPTVDFSKEMVVLVALGTKATGGYTAEIERVRRVSDGISVDYVAESPGDRCGTTAALTQPMDFVIVPRVEGLATFARHNQTSNC